MTSFVSKNVYLAQVLDIKETLNAENEIEFTADIEHVFKGNNRVGDTVTDFVNGKYQGFLQTGERYIFCTGFANDPPVTGDERIDSYGYGTLVHINNHVYNRSDDGSLTIFEDGIEYIQIEYQNYRFPVTSKNNELVEETQMAEIVDIGKTVSNLWLEWLENHHPFVLQSQSISLPAASDTVGAVSDISYLVSLYSGGEVTVRFVVCKMCSKGRGMYGFYDPSTGLLFPVKSWEGPDDNNSLLKLLEDTLKITLQS